MGTPASWSTSFIQAFDPFEPGGRRPGPEGQPAPGLDGVDGARHQRHLGADHDQVGGDLVGEVGHGTRVAAVDRHAAPERGDPRVAGRADDLLHLGRPGQRMGQGVFPPPRPDDQDAHSG